MFEWNRQYPCPTDKAVIDIYKDYLKYKQDIIQSWKKGVSNGLIGERDYKDLEDVRLNIKWGNKGFTPVFSLKPVIGDEATKQIEKYHSFFGTYMLIRDRLLTYTQAPFPRSQDTTEYIHNHVTILKILICSWYAGIYKDEYFDLVRVSYNPAALAHFYETIFSVGTFAEYPFVSKRDDKYIVMQDSYLIGSFYRYNRKMVKRYEEMQSERRASSTTAKIDESLFFE